MINEKNDANIMCDFKPSLMASPNPEEPQYKQFGTGVPKTDGITLVWIAVGTVIMIWVFTWLLGI